jgi:hypothetical protein
MVCAGAPWARARVPLAASSVGGSIMKRENRLVVAMLVFVLGTVSWNSSQDLRSRRSPEPPTDILGPQLIAWSEMQRPQPVPQPLPPPDRPLKQPDQPDRQAAQPANPQAQPERQTFTGTIVKEGSKYLLKVSIDGIYQLDDQDKARQYEGKQVRIEGTLDASSNRLHIRSIELLS